MAFILTPRYAPAYQAPQCNPFGFCAPVSRPTYAYRISRPQPRRPAYSPFNHFLTQVDELLSDIDREAQRQAQIKAQREARRQQQQREQALRANFTVNQNDNGWQLDGDIHGFEQQNINIEVTGEHTLKVAGNTEWRSEVPEQHQPTAEQLLIGGAENDKTDNTSITESKPQSSPPSEPEIVRSATPSSDAGSHKSYQAFVEDDFEDLGAETSSISSTSSEVSTTARPNEPKGKEKAVEEPATTESAVIQQPQAVVPAENAQQEQPQREERPHGSFEHTFTFPERIDANNVSASFKDGVLRITVPKAPTPQIKRIAVL